MKKRKPKKRMKPVKAWAVLNEEGEPDYDHGMTPVLYPTRDDATPINRRERIVRVEIREVPKRRHKRAER